jgi:hypothetical protein
MLFVSMAYASDIQGLDADVSALETEATSLRVSLATVESAVPHYRTEVMAARSDVDSLTAHIEELNSIIADLEAVKRAPAPSQSSRSGHVIAPAPTALSLAAGEHGGTWSRAKLAGVLSAACDYYGVDNKDWLVAKGVHISADGECKSGDTARRNFEGSTALGLFQFLKLWNPTGEGCFIGGGHGASDWRACGTCSAYRFVGVYSEGGDSALKRAWEATYY